VQPHSNGSVTLASTDPAAAPLIEYGYFTDPHDMKVHVAIMRRTLEIAREMGLSSSSLFVPHALAEKHGYRSGGELSDAILEEWTYLYAATYNHPTSSCRMGSVVDPQLRVKGASGLRVADASVMPNITSGNTHATCVMIGEKCAEMVADEYGLALKSMAKDEAKRCCTAM